MTYNIENSTLICDRYGVKNATLRQRHSTRDKFDNKHRFASSCFDVKFSVSRYEYCNNLCAEDSILIYRYCCESSFTGWSWRFSWKILMHYNPLYSEHVSEETIPPKCWHRPLVRIVGISFIILTIFVVTLSLVLKFIILAPSELEIIVTVTPSVPPVTTTVSSRQTTTSTETTTTTATRTSTTSRWPGKRYIGDP